MTRPSPFPGGKIARQHRSQPGGYKKITLTPEQEAWLRKYFPTVRGDILRQMTGLSLTTFYRILRDLGISKTQAVRSRIWRAASAKGKKKMEANGYYASLRGQAPSAETIEGRRRRWQLVREGKAEHPLQTLKREHPQIYKRKMVERGERRKRQIKMERLRLMSGMPSETKLRFAVVPYTRSQCNHRSSAIRRGYWVYEDCSEQGGERWNIYYDQDTQRAPIFETNLRKDGFTVKDGTNL